MVYTVTLDERGMFHHICCKGYAEPYFKGFKHAGYTIYDVQAESIKEAIGLAQGLFSKELKEVDA